MGPSRVDFLNEVTAVILDKGFVMVQRNLPAEDLLKQLEKNASGLLANATGAEPALYWNKDIADLEEQNIFLPEKEMRLN